MVRNRVRVAGSAYTAFTFGGQPIAFAEQISHASGAPVAQATPIHPMDEPYAVQIITPAAMGPGTLTLALTDLYRSKVWDRLGAQLGYADGSVANNTDFTKPGGSNEVSIGEAILAGAVDIVDVFVRISQAPPGTVNVVKYIRPPLMYGDTQRGKPFVEQYVNCVVSDIDDGEQVAVGTMQVVHNVTVMYTHKLRNGQPSAALKTRL